MNFVRTLLAILFFHSVFLCSAQLDPYPTTKEIEMFMDTFLVSYTNRPAMEWRPEYDLNIFTKGTDPKVCDFFSPAECAYLMQQTTRDNERKWKKRMLKKAGL